MHQCLKFIFFGVLVSASAFRLDSVPPLWWDEGWTLSVARNWTELGHYGRLLIGQRISGGLEAAPTLTASIALSFELFGRGIVQARIVPVMFSLACIGFLYHIAQRLYNRRVALGTLLVLIVLPSYVELFSAYMGRQLLGEMPAMFFLLAGYLSVLYLGRCLKLALLMAVFFWAMALSTKLQVVPFWLCSMIVPIWINIRARDWRVVLFWTIALFGALLGAHLLPRLWELVLHARADIADPISGLYLVTAAVWSIPARMFALLVTVLIGVPTLLGLLYGLWDLHKNSRSLLVPTDQVKVALLCFALSWFAWFGLFSVGWIRYIFPAVFIGSIFVAAMMHDFTRGFDVSYTLRWSLAFFTGRAFNKQAIGALFVVAVMLTSVPRTAMALYKTYIVDADTSVQQAAQFLNTQIPPHAVIETYDSELFFFLNGLYHYPPDQVHVALIRRTFLYEDNTRIDYDPLAADPDYLVVGPHSKQWKLYDEVLKTGAFQLIRSYPRYVIYKRAR